jgi:hypothetical protein
MEDFSLDHPELTGSLISLNFGPGGRIHELWVSDPSMPLEGDEYQFVLPMIRFGEEFAEDCYPGTILIGARARDDEPWILSRNSEAQMISDPDNPRRVSFEYEFSLLPEIHAVGHFYETGTDVAEVVWDVTISNQGREGIEIGELGFPFAFNNFISGPLLTANGKSLWDDRVHIHKCIGGAASYLFAQRMNSEPPGLLVYPGDDTSWEFYASIRSSINTPYRWEGIPVVYILSRAAVEREGWGNWFNEHTSLILGPGESKTFQTRFVPAMRGKFDGVSQVLNACGRPAIRLLPSAVTPVDVGVAIEVAGTTPTRFHVSRSADLETDSDENGGFCFVRPKTTGPMRVSFEDTQGRTSHAHLFFTEPIDKLIEARAKWICENQLHEEPGTAFHHAIVPVDIRTGQHMTQPDQIVDPFVVESGLADMMFLAEKNVHYPNKEQIKVLDDCIRDFVFHDVQNPSSFAVGSCFADQQSVAINYGHALPYVLLCNTYRSMRRIALRFGWTEHKPEVYLDYAYQTAMAMFQYAFSRNINSSVPGTTDMLIELMSDLIGAGHTSEADDIAQIAQMRSDLIRRRAFPIGEPTGWNAAEFAEYLSVAMSMRQDDMIDRSIQAAFAGRSLSPSYWWCGVDKQQPFEVGEVPHPAFVDKGEYCSAYVTTINSLMFFATLDRDFSVVPEAYIRQAFSGALSCWAHVRADGAASMGFCPDSSSKIAGFSPVTGDIGRALYEYMKFVGSYVLPSRHFGTFAFGCHYEYDQQNYKVRPWDGVGRFVTLCQIGLSCNVSYGRIIEIQVDTRKTQLTVEIANPCDKAMKGELFVRGLWGNKVSVGKQTIAVANGGVTIPYKFPRRGKTTLEIKVIE